MSMCELSRDRNELWLNQLMKQIPGIRQGIPPDGLSRVCVVGDAGVKLRSQIGVALEPDPP